MQLVTEASDNEKIDGLAGCADVCSYVLFKRNCLSLRHTLSETSSSHLQIHGWEDFHLMLSSKVLCYFQGRLGCSQNHLLVVSMHTSCSR